MVSTKAEMEKGPFLSGPQEMEAGKRITVTVMAIPIPFTRYLSVLPLKEVVSLGIWKNVRLH